MNVDIILAPASTQVAPARNATSRIPIIFAQHADPVGTGECRDPRSPTRNEASRFAREQASKYYLILNFKTAKAIGIDLSPTVIARADEVIE